MNIDYRFSVAPMMGYTTPHGRYLYRLMSKKAVLFTEMVASKALLNDSIVFSTASMGAPLWPIIIISPDE